MHSLNRLVRKCVQLWCKTTNKPGRGTINMRTLNQLQICLLLFFFKMLYNSYNQNKTRVKFSFRGTWNTFTVSRGWPTTTLEAPAARKNTNAENECSNIPEKKKKSDGCNHRAAGKEEKVFLWNSEVKWETQPGQYLTDILNLFIDNSNKLKQDVLHPKTWSSDLWLHTSLQVYFS